MSKRLPSECAWAGYIDGHVDVIIVREVVPRHGPRAGALVSTRDVYAPAIYRSREEAKRNYEDVRRVRIVPIAGQGGDGGE